MTNQFPTFLCDALCWYITQSQITSSVKDFLKNKLPWNGLIPVKVEMELTPNKKAHTLFLLTQSLTGQTKTSPQKSFAVSLQSFSPTSLLAEPLKSRTFSSPCCHLPHRCLLHHCLPINVNVTVVNKSPPYRYPLPSPSLAPGVSVVDCPGILLRS